jgi:hypothetical protein
MLPVQFNMLRKQGLAYFVHRKKLRKSVYLEHVHEAQSTKAGHFGASGQGGGTEEAADAPNPSRGDAVHNGGRRRA